MIMTNDTSLGYMEPRAMTVCPVCDINVRYDKINFILSRTIYKQIPLVWGYCATMKCKTVKCGTIQVTLMLWSGIIPYSTMNRTNVTDIIPLGVWTIRLHKYYTIDRMNMCTQGQTTGQLTLCSWRYIQHSLCFLVRHSISLHPGNKKVFSPKPVVLTLSCTSFIPPRVSYVAVEGQNKSFK